MFKKLPNLGNLPANEQLKTDTDKEILKALKPNAFEQI